jgi:hypothetical protein
MPRADDDADGNADHDDGGGVVGVVAVAGVVVAVVVVVVVVIMPMAIATGGVPVLDAETPAAHAEEAGRKEGRRLVAQTPLGRVGLGRRDTRPKVRLAIVSSC